MIVEFTLNGEQPHAAVADPGSALDLLRDQLGLLGPRAHVSRGNAVRARSCSMASGLLLSGHGGDPQARGDDGRRYRGRMKISTRCRRRCRRPVPCSAGSARPGSLSPPPISSHNPTPSGRRDQRGPGREHLPVHRVRRHPPGSGRAGPEGRAMTTSDQGRRVGCPQWVIRDSPIGRMGSPSSRGVRIRPGPEGRGDALGGDGAKPACPCPHRFDRRRARPWPSGASTPV